MSLQSVPSSPLPPSPFGIGSRWQNLFPVGNCHHADFLKQSPPLDSAQYKEFMRGEIGNMKAAGFNVYNMEFGWLDMEYKPDRWDFSRTDAVWELCEEFDLPVFGWLFAELTPRWLIKLYPETAAIAATGYHSETHSFGSQKALERIRNFIHTVVRRYGNHPRMAGFNVGIETALFWIEPQDSQEPAAFIWDYNPDVLAGYAPWLAKKYGSLDRLNLYYRDHYEDFAEVQPPNSRFISEQFMLINQLGWLDWRLYMIDVLTNYVHFKADAVRELLPEAFLSDQSIAFDPARQAQDIWAINQKMNVLGTSRFVSNDPGDSIRFDYWDDYLRSSNKGKPYWIWELRCGQNAWGLTNWGAPVSAADVGRYTWQAIGQEAKSIQYWNWRPHIGGVEVGGHGFTNRDGSLTDRAIRIGALAKQLNQKSAWMQSARMPQAHIAILDSTLSRIIAAGEGSDALVIDSQMGAYSLFKAQGYYLDFVNEAEIRASILENYRLLVVPFAYALAEETALAIKDWVSQGGFLFSGMWCGAKDEYGFGQFHVPGFGLHEVFGAQESRLTPVVGAADIRPGNTFAGKITGRATLRIINPMLPGGAAQPGQTFTGRTYLSSLKPELDAEVIAIDERGDALAVRNHFGKGQAFMLGTFPIPEKEYSQTGLSRLAHDFAGLAGVPRPAVILNRADEEVAVKLLEGDQRSGLLILLNNHPAAFDFNVCLLGRKMAAAENFETGLPVAFQVAGDNTFIRLMLEPGDAAGIFFTER